MPALKSSTTSFYRIYVYVCFTISINISFYHFCVLPLFIIKMAVLSWEFINLYTLVFRENNLHAAK